MVSNTSHGVAETPSNYSLYFPNGYPDVLDRRANKELKKKALKNYVHENLRVLGGRPFEELVRASPDFLSSSSFGRSFFILAAFPDRDQLLCMGQDYANAHTGLLEEFEDYIEHMQYIVPAYMTARSGMTIANPKLERTAHLSARCNENTGSPRFVIYRNDIASLDDQASSIIRLAQKVPLAAVVVSGEGRLDAWFAVSNLSATAIKKFRKDATYLGSGDDTHLNCRLVALPGGPFVGRKFVHKIVYFDSAVFNA
jgi:hypothetical protein